MKCTESSIEMYPATAATLTKAFDWSDMADAMLVSAHADSNCKSGLEKYKHCKYQGIIETIKHLAYLLTLLKTPPAFVQLWH